jgi:hypothetical protein
VFLAVFSLFTAATALFFWEWMPHLHSALIGPPEDNMQDFWNTWYVTVARTPGRFFFTDLIRFPEGTPLYYHSFAYPKLAVIAVLSKIFGVSTASLILQQNLAVLISFPLAGTGAFYLVRYLTASTGGALVGGFIYAFNPSHIEHAMHHVGVSSIEFIPFFVLTYLLAIKQKSLLLLLSAIVFYALNTLSCWYYLFYVGYFIVFHTVYVAIRDRTYPKGWQLLAPVACLVGVLAVLSPLLVPMVKAAVGGASVYAEGSDKYVADVFAYAAFPRFHLLAPLADGIYSRLREDVWEATVYLGWVNIAVLAWLCFAARRKDIGLVTYVLCGMGLFCVLASGDSLHVLWHESIPMPDLVLSQLPFFKNVRTPSRAIMFVYLFLAIGVGYAISLASRYPQRLIDRWVVAVVSGLIVLDFFPARRLPMTPVVCSPGLAVIRDDPAKGFGVLNLPNSKPDYEPGNFYMLQQTCHGRPIAQGNTSRNVVVSLRDHLETSDLQAQRRQLASARIKYIVIYRQAMGSQLPWRPEDGPQDQYPVTYPVAYDSPDLSILRVY